MEKVLLKTLPLKLSNSALVSSFIYKARKRDKNRFVSELVWTNDTYSRRLGGTLPVTGVWFLP